MPPTYLESEASATLIGRSEIQRREKYMQMLGKEHPLMSLIEQCLHHNQSKRPDSFWLTQQFKDDISYSKRILDVAKEVCIHCSYISLFDPIIIDPDLIFMAIKWKGWE